MGLIWLQSRAELRDRWRAVVLLALVVAVGGGVALTTLAGARRTDSAMARFVAYSLPDDGGFLYGSVTSPPLASGPAANSLALPPVERRVAHLPQVAAYFRAPYLFLTTNRSGYNSASLNAIGDFDPALYRSVDRPLVVAGHLPDPTRPFEAAINEFAAEKGHLHVGSPVRLYAYSAAQFRNGGLVGNVATVRVPAGPSFMVRVTAIVRFPQDINAVLPLAAKADVSYEGQENLYLTPAFPPRLAAGLGIPVGQIPNANLVGVRLRHGAADWRAFAAAAKTIGGNQVFVSAGNVHSVHQAAASAQRGIHLEVVALLLFGALAALLTILLVGQAFARQIQRKGSDYATLRSLGASRAQLLAVVLLQMTVIGVGGSVLALIVAISGSPLMPIGPARQAEIHPGLDVDLAVLIPGLLGLALLIALSSLRPAWRVSRHTAATVGEGMADTHLSRLARTLGRTSAPVVATIGVQFGTDPGRGRRAVPVFSAMFGAVLAVAAIAAALTFGAGLGHLVDSPRQQGWNWDVLVGNPNNLTDQEARTGTQLARNRFVGGYSAIAILAGANQGNVVIDGKVVDLLLAFDPLKGSVYPPLLEGRAPRATQEIVLASQTLKELHRRIGQSVQVAGPVGRPIMLHIVGRMISPSVGDLFTNKMGDGGWVYGPALRQQQGQTSSGQGAAPPTVFTLFAVRYAHGVAPGVAYASLRRQFGAVVLGHLPSEDVINLQSVDRLPTLMAGLVVLLGVAAVGNTLVASVRQRRRDLAVLKTIGLVRRQVAEVVAWQATSFSVVALIIGLPLGVAGGRWAWSAVVSNVGSVSPPVVPAMAIGIIVPATLLVANAIAAWPGWAAARVSPAVVMRSE